jgi:hypothetical protein
MDEKPDATLEGGQDKAVLYRNYVMKYGKSEIQCDRIEIEYGTGNTDSVVFYEDAGETQVGRIKQGFSVLQGSASATTAFDSFVLPVSTDDNLRLSALYNKLLEIANSKPA